MAVKKQTPSRLHPMCCHCGLPVVPGQAHWAGDPEGRPWHYACAEKADLVVPHRTWMLQARRAS
jgi:hypothetical protein